MRKGEIRKGRTTIRGVLRTRGLRWATGSQSSRNLSKKLCRTYLRNITPAGIGSTPSLLIECGPLGTLTPLHFHVALAWGQFRWAKARIGRTSITCTALSSSPTACASLQIYITHFLFIGLTSVAGAECPLGMCAE